MPSQKALSCTEAGTCVTALAPRTTRPCGTNRNVDYRDRGQRTAPTFEPAHTRARQRGRAPLPNSGAHRNGKPRADFVVYRNAFAGLDRYGDAVTDTLVQCPGLFPTVDPKQHVPVVDEGHGQVPFVSRVEHRAPRHRIACRLASGALYAGGDLKAPDGAHFELRPTVRLMPAVDGREAKQR